MLLSSSRKKGALGTISVIANEVKQSAKRREVAKSNRGDLLDRSG